MLIRLIDDRYDGIDFRHGFGSLIGTLPDRERDDWSIVYEKEDDPNSDKMVLWMYQDDFDYFSAMIPTTEREIKKCIKKWFERLTKLNVDLVHVQ